MTLTKQVKGIRKDKEAKIARGVTRQSDMPACADCHKPIIGAAVAGYDGKWRCLMCNALHGAAVLRESGESAPLPSDESPGRAAAPTPEATEARRQKRAAAILEKYGVVKKCAS